MPFRSFSKGSEADHLIPRSPGQVAKLWQALCSQDGRPTICHQPRMSLRVGITSPVRLKQTPSGITDRQHRPRLCPKGFVYLQLIFESGFILSDLLETWKVGWEELNDKMSQPKKSREGI